MSLLFLFKHKVVWFFEKIKTRWSRVSCFCILFVWCLNVGVDFKVKYLNMDGKKLKLAIWDTGVHLCLFIYWLMFHFIRWCFCNFLFSKVVQSVYNDMVWFNYAAGQERFRTLTSSYYRGAQGIIMGEFQFCVSSFTTLPVIFINWVKLKYHFNIIVTVENHSCCLRELTCTLIDKS